jgi:inner membrane protein
MSLDDARQRAKGLKAEITLGADPQAEREARRAVRMDTLTHSLPGAVFVRSVLRAQHSAHPISNRERLLVGSITGAFPDMDVVACWVMPMIFLTVWHRGLTHPFTMRPQWTLLNAVIFSFLLRKRGECRYLFVGARMAMNPHIASDLITVYVAQLLAPPSTWRASVGTTFIIDPWFALIAPTGFIASIKDCLTVFSQASLVVLVAYLPLQGVLKPQALALGREHVQREAVPAIRSAAFPQPFSPFNWKVAVEAAEYHDVACTSLSGGYAGTRAALRPAGNPTRPAPGRALDSPSRGPRPATGTHREVRSDYLGSVQTHAMNVRRKSGALR